MIVSLCHTSAKPFFHGGTLMKFMDMYPFFFYSIWVLGCFSKLTRKNIEILTKTSRGPRAGSDQKLPDVDEKWSYQAKKKMSRFPSKSLTFWPKDTYLVWDLDHPLVSLNSFDLFTCIPVSTSICECLCLWSAKVTYIYYIFHILTIYIIWNYNHKYANYICIYIYMICVYVQVIFLLSNLPGLLQGSAQLQ